MKAFIYVGGKILPENISEAPTPEDLVIAADAGLANALKLGVTPTLALGDFDSYPVEKIPRGIEVLQVPAEKDETDTQLAVSTALQRGAAELVIIGGLSGRLDHTLSNLALLEDLNRKHIRGTLTDGHNRVRFIRNDGIILLREGYKYFSVIAADPLVKGVSIDGCKYPLKNAKITKYNQFAVSNEIRGNCALIEIRRGGAWIVESNDLK